MKSNTALVVEGGAMRSVFSAGLLDGFISEGFNPFDFYIGVSAGAYNLTTYLNNVPSIGFNLFEQFATSREFINICRFLCGGHLLDLDWIEHFALSSPLIDLQRVFAQGRPFFVGMTVIETGAPIYIQVTPDNISSVIKASTALPWFYRDFPCVNDRSMTDGGVSDSIPVGEAIRMGATRIMVVRARHKHYLKKDSPAHRFVRWKMRAYPRLQQALAGRVISHNDVITLIRNPPTGVSIIEICPPENFSLGRFSRNRQQLRDGYQFGIESASEAIAQWMFEAN
jgi:predicted patatin/cPLA2 family phospholipase